MQPTACPELVEGASAVGVKWEVSQPRRGVRVSHHKILRPGMMHHDCRRTLLRLQQKS